jgi:hypothetical protein
MLPASLNQFQKNISDLKKYIDLGIVAYESSIENLSKEDSLQNESIKSFLDNYQEIRTFTKIMNYSAIVITLYGTLERYLENVAKEYLICLCQAIPGASHLCNE